MSQVKSRRINFQDTLQHKKPAQLVLDLGGCPLSSMSRQTEEQILAYMGFSPKKQRNPHERIDARILEALDIDTRGVGQILSVPKSLRRKISDVEYIDDWGIRRRFGGMYWDIVEHPLCGATREDLSCYSWPQADSLDIKQVEAFAKQARHLYEHTDYVICGEHPVYGILELGCWLFGYDDFLIKMAVEPDTVRAFFEIVLDYQKKISRVYYEAIGPYIHYTSSGDDFALQADTFISPEMFQALIKPFFQERIAYVKQYTNAAFLHHSCGNVAKIIPDMIDAGVDILNPIQPCAPDMQPHVLKQKFGERICFHGGIDTQQLLRMDDQAKMMDQVEHTMTILSQDGGYIFAAAHNLQEDVCPENIIAVFSTARKRYSSTT